MLPSRSAILVHEQVTGGGWPSRELPHPLAAEALSIVRAAVEDLRTWGRFPVVVTRDLRISNVPLVADRVIDLGVQAYPANLVEVARQCQGVLLVAPESGAAHARLSAHLVKAGVRLLGSAPEAIAVAGDKWECQRRFVDADLPTPVTECVPPGQAARAARRLGYPVVVKPVMGAACQGVGFVPCGDVLAGALERCALWDEERILVQGFAPGRQVSVSLLVSRGRSAPLGLNEQKVRLGTPCEYLGGVACVSDPRLEEALELAVRAVDVVPGLQGYVGVDMVLTEAGCSLIEINPRVTTSYLGLRGALPVNLAEAIWRACREGSLPPHLGTAPAVPFARDDAHDI